MTRRRLVVAAVAGAVAGAVLAAFCIAIRELPSTWGDPR